MDKIKLLTQAWDLVNQAGGGGPKECNKYYRILIHLEAAIANEYNVAHVSERN